MHHLLLRSSLVNILVFSFGFADARFNVLNHIFSRSDLASSKPVTLPYEKHEGRMLRAAQLTSDLRPRSIQETLRHDHELHYLDESLHGTSAQFAARLSMISKEPTLVLEEIEEHLKTIECNGTQIELGFDTAESLALAFEEYSAAGQFFLITSHDGCNNDGARNAHLVSEVAILETEKRMVLFVSHLPWKDAFHSMTVDFGGSNAEYELRRHDGLRKRAQPTASTSAYLAASTSISFPIPPSGSPVPKGFSAQGYVGFQYLDTSILPPNIPGVDNVALHGPFVPQGLTIKCKNCTTRGTIDLIQGSFTLDQTNGTSNGTENVIQFFQNGYMELRVDDFAAHIELESSIQPSASLTLYTVPLPEIGLPGFQIPGIAVVGPYFNPKITMRTQLNSVFDFIYGFDVVVPKNSSIIINIGNVTNSSITGFPDTKISAIPFQAAFDSISLSLSTSFTPELLLGISVFDGLGTAGAGVIFDLPTVKATVSQVAHVNSKCDPVANSTDGKLLDDVFGSLTNIVPEVGFDLGLIAQADIQAGPFTVGGSERWTAVSTAFSLPTVCMSFNAAAKTFGVATVSASPTATGKGHGEGLGKKNAAAASSTNPFTQLIHHFGRLDTSTVLLSIVLGCILSL